jgi:hypothetical protein
VFLGYSNLHKGFKCLDVAGGRVYISSNVVFDEGMYPFSKLNPNTHVFGPKSFFHLNPDHYLSLATGVQFHIFLMLVCL